MNHVKCMIKTKLKFFKESEFTDFSKMDSKLLSMIDMVRLYVGRPVILTSTYRPPDHPIEAKKKRPGEHTYGAAVDIKTVGGKETFEIVNAAIRAGFTRIGINRKKNFVHLGIGYPGASPVTIWTY